MKPCFSDPQSSTLNPRPLRVFAVIPAAGHSRRMGQPKLLLPLQGQTVIARLLDALQHPAIAARVVVVRAGDVELQHEVRRAGGTVISPEVDPPDMRSSVEHGLQFVAATWSPSTEDAWLLAPGDHPVLDRQAIAELLQVFESQRPRFQVPIYRSRRGHPLLARWETAEEVFRLPPDVGLNRLLRDSASAVIEHPIDSPAVLTDLDTPEDYARLVEHLEAADPTRDARPPG